MTDIDFMHRMMDKEAARLADPAYPGHVCSKVHPADPHALWLKNAARDRAFTPSAEPCGVTAPDA